MEPSDLHDPINRGAPFFNLGTDDEAFIGHVFAIVALQYHSFGPHHMFHLPT